MVQYVSWNKGPTLDTIASYHKPIWINLEGMETNFQKPFCFKQMWMTDKGCGEIIEIVWTENSLDLWDIKVLKKIDKCGHELSRWSKRNFGNVRQDLEKKKRRIAIGKETFNMDWRF